MMASRNFARRMFMLLALANGAVLRANQLADIRPLPQTVWNFAYGANMNVGSLKKRGVTPMKSFPAVLPNWILRFDMIGLPWLEPAFGNIEPAKHQSVHGVALLLTAEEFQKLREAEGGGGYPGEGYDLADVKVYTYDGRKIDAKAFVAVPRWKHAALPSLRYMNLLVEGAHQHRLDESYTQKVLVSQKHEQASWGARALVVLAVAPILLPAWVGKKTCLAAGWSILWYEKLLLSLAKAIWWIHG